MRAKNVVFEHFFQVKAIRLYCDEENNTPVDRRRIL